MIDTFGGVLHHVHNSCEILANPIWFHPGGRSFAAILNTFKNHRITHHVMEVAKQERPFQRSDIEDICF